jgi:hypothetical protein
MSSMLRLARTIGQMERIPHGYGVAWVRWDQNVAVCLPIGLHLLASWLREAWLRFRLWRAPDLLAEAQERAFQAGFSSGQETARASRESELARRRQEIEQDAIHRFIEQSIAELDSRRECH